MDDASLGRVLALIKYWAKTAPGAKDESTWREPTEADLKDSFGAAQMMMGTNIQKIPADLRDAIDWAEKIKQEHRL